MPPAVGDTPLGSRQNHRSAVDACRRGPPRVSVVTSAVSEY